MAQRRAVKDNGITGRWQKTGWVGNKSTGACNENRKIQISGYLKPRKQLLPRFPVVSHILPCDIRRLHADVGPAKAKRKCLYEFRTG